MSYRITRECWNEKTYNGYEDSPYWKVMFDGYEIGLKDNGEHWDIKQGDSNKPHIIEKLKTIIKECGLKIKLKICNAVQN